MNEKTPQFKPKLRAIALAVATGIIGWGLPKMGVGDSAVPYIISVGFLLFTLVCITDDWVKYQIKRLPDKYCLRITTVGIIIISVTTGSYCISAKIINDQNSEDKQKTERELLIDDTKELIEDVTVFQLEMNSLSLSLSDSYWASTELGKDVKEE